jgi:hypothetical protein
MAPAAAHPLAGHVGRPEREKGLEAERPWALVTVAVTVGVTPVTAQEGAVHTTWLVLAVFCAAASEPVVAVQAKDRVLA